MGFLDGINNIHTGNVNIGEGVKYTKIVPDTTTPITITSSSTRFTSANFNTDLDALQGKVRVNSPEAQGLASAEQVRNGELVSGYHFDDINSQGGKFDVATFDIKYNTANAPAIRQGTQYACEGIEYTQVATNLQSKDNPYAELFV